MAPADALELAAAAFVVALGGTVALGLLNGRINTRGLLDDKVVGGISGARIQLLVATLFGAAGYFLLVLEHRAHGGFPDVPTELLVVAGGSNAVYLFARLAPVVAKLLRKGS